MIWPPRHQRPQSFSASPFTAGAFGFLLWGANILEWQADARFEIAAVIAHSDVAAKIDDFVTELHLDATWKLAAYERTVWHARAARRLRSGWPGAQAGLAGN